ncbi:hypothetical protein F4780DRAFT_790015, partial [Xylariomycetidae sp. FL0641]
MVSTYNPVALDVPPGRTGRYHHFHSFASPETPTVFPCLSASFCETANAPLRGNLLPGSSLSYLPYTLLPYYLRLKRLNYLPTHLQDFPLPHLPCAPRWRPPTRPTGSGPASRRSWCCSWSPGSSAPPWRPPWRTCWCADCGGSAPSGRSSAGRARTRSAGRGCPPPGRRTSGCPTSAASSSSATWLLPGMVAPRRAPRPPGRTSAPMAGSTRGRCRRRGRSPMARSSPFPFDGGAGGGWAGLAAEGRSG